MTLPSPPPCPTILDHCTPSPPHHHVIIFSLSIDCGTVPGQLLIVYYLTTWQCKSSVFFLCNLIKFNDFETAPGHLVFCLYKSNLYMSPCVLVFFIIIYWFRFTILIFDNCSKLGKPMILIYAKRTRYNFELNHV